MYCSVRGIKVPCICGEKISVVTRLCLKTSHCSCFLYRWIAFWKDKSFFNRNTCVQQEKISTVGAALGAVFIKKTQSNYPISLFSRTGILSRNSKIALIITPKLLTCCKKAFFLASSEKYFSNKRNKKWARCTIDDRGWESMLIAVLRDISFACSVPSSWAIAQYYGDLEPCRWQSVANFYRHR